MAWYELMLKYTIIQFWSEQFFVDKILVSSFNNDLMLNLQQYDGRETVHRKSPSYNDVYNYIS